MVSMHTDEFKLFGADMIRLMNMVLQVSQVLGR